jgi:hypothetical protein
MNKKIPGSQLILVEMEKASIFYLIRKTLCNQQASYLLYLRFLVEYYYFENRKL